MDLPRQALFTAIPHTITSPLRVFRFDVHPTQAQVLFFHETTLPHYGFLNIGYISRFTRCLGESALIRKDKDGPIGHVRAGNTCRNTRLLIT